MKRIIYLSLLFVIPLMLKAEHGRKRLDGKWISPYYNTQIRIKVKRHEIRVKGLSRRGWTDFRAVRRNVFEDWRGNRIKLKNMHTLVYIKRYGGERIRFMKKGHRRHNHVCNSSCSIGNNYFGSHGAGHHNQDYDGEWEDDSWGFTKNYKRNRFDGKYFVREIDEYVTINSTRNGLKARRGNGKWVNYKQNRNRKNEYLDNKGNRYLVRNDGSITWKNNKGTVTLNLQK